MNAIQFTLIMVWFGTALAVLGWISYQSSSRQPSRIYTAIADRVEAVFTVLTSPIHWLFDTRIMRKLFG